MITAHHSVLANALFRPSLSVAIRFCFHGFYACNRPAPLDGKPLILTPNHSSWWDGFFAYQLNEHFFRRTFSILMLDRELRSRRFFRKLGACSLERKNPSDVQAAFRYLEALLRNPQSLLVFFPQGRIEPEASSPLHLRPGLRLLKESGATILPAYFRLEQLNCFRPSVFCAFAEPLSFDQYSAAPEILRHGLLAAREVVSDTLRERKPVQRVSGRAWQWEMLD